MARQCSSFDRSRDQGPLHIVSAWASEWGLVLGQRQFGDVKARLGRHLHPCTGAHRHIHFSLWVVFVRLSEWALVDMS